MSFNFGRDYLANNHEIFVVDSPCGAGKTSFAIQNITIYERANGFIYVTPYLEEVERVKSKCEEFGIEVYEPDIRRGFGSKTSDFKELLVKGKNIITTHSMFDRIDETMIDIIRSNNYVLYLDEVHEVIKEHYLDEQDFKLLVETKCIEFSDGNLVKWVKEEYDTNNGKFTEFRNLCDLGAVYYYKGKLFLWCFPIRVFEAMKKTYILTYMFEGQLQSAYYKLHNVPYEMMWINKDGSFYTLKDYKVEYDIAFRREIKDKIHIYEGNLNFQRGITLSSSWFKEKADENDLEVVKNNTYNYFKHKIKGCSDKNMWTCLKDFRHKLKGKGYSKGFIELNARSTNKYKHKTNLAYLFNRYMKPPIYNFLITHNIEFDNDMYALGDLIQWIFRSAIREGEDINIYIPSLRMRELLKEYLGK